MKNLFLLGAIALQTVVLAQTPSNIEAVEYEPVGNRWFVSNGSNTMLVTSDAGESWDYFGSANASYGMEVMNGVLYVIHQNQIFAYNVDTAELLGSTSVTGAGFLNGMGSNGEGILVVSDYSNGRIIKIDATDPSDMQVSTLVANAGITVNGVVIDSANDLAYVVDFSNNADIISIDINTGIDNVVVNNSGYNICDGIDMDSEGNFYISTWSPARIIKYNSDFSESEIVVSSGLSSPADISYAMEIDTLAVANSGSTQVTFHSFANTENTSELIQIEESIKLLGNTIEFNLPTGGEFILKAYSLEGRLVATESISLLTGKTRVEIERLPAGFTDQPLINVLRVGKQEGVTLKQGLRRF